MKVSAARHAAREVVSRVRERSSYAHEVLDSVLKTAKLSTDDASLATRLAYGTLQTIGTLDEAIDERLTGKRVEPRVRDALQVSAYEILFLRTPDRAAVHQGVELVREVRPQAAGLANAVLRRLAEAAPAFPWGDPDADVAALARLHGHPRWLAEMWVAELGRQTAAEVMAADNEPAPLFLAVNPFCAPVDDARAALRADGASPKPCPVVGCVEAGNPSAAVHGSALRDGLAVATDAAAQLVTRLVPVTPGSTIVEVGSGRGTKTLLLQARAVQGGGAARILAVDLHGFKARLLEERLARYGVPGVETLVGDATDIGSIPGIPDNATVDAVLIDAPCTGLGTLRRHPEKRWRVTPADVEALGNLGLRLLSSASVLVRPGGFVVYSTCTIAERENARVVRDFLASEQGASFRVDSLSSDVPEAWREYVTEEGFFSSVPAPGGPDGHFAARLVRV